MSTPSLDTAEHAVAPHAVTLDGLDRQLLDCYQRGLPLVERPFARLAAELGTEEAEVLARLSRLQADGVVTRVGPVFRPHAVGASLLAAMAVPQAQLERVARYVSGYVEVNHNYERFHPFNLWFVVTAPTASAVEEVLTRIETGTGLAVMRLPMLRDYHIDLAFSLDGEAAGKRRPHPVCGGAKAGKASASLDEPDRRLVAAVQDGVPLVSYPYRVVAMRAGLSEGEVIERLERWLQDGIVRRIGVVVRHHELGYRANGMVVWDVPDERVDQVGEAMAQHAFVTLCYRRPRRPPEWQYNLFCMIHGRDKTRVCEQVETLACACGIEDAPRDVLFSGRRFKQRGARYEGANTSQGQVSVVHGGD